MNELNGKWIITQKVAGMQYSFNANFKEDGTISVDDHPEFFGTYRQGPKPCFVIADEASGHTFLDNSVTGYLSLSEVINGAQIDSMRGIAGGAGVNQGDASKITWSASRI